MADIMKATCKNGQVFVDGVLVVAEITGAGKGESSGMLILDKTTGIYIPDQSPDLVAIIEQMSNALDTISGGIDSVYIATQGGAPGPGATQIKNGCQRAKQALDKLKGQLI